MQPPAAEAALTAPNAEQEQLAQDSAQEQEFVSLKARGLDPLRKALAALPHEHEGAEPTARGPNDPKPEESEVSQLLERPLESGPAKVERTSAQIPRGKKGGKADIAATPESD